MPLQLAITIILIILILSGIIYQKERVISKMRQQDLSNSTRIDQLEEEAEFWFDKWIKEAYKHQKL
jgi:hypothetical protein